MKRHAKQLGMELGLKVPYNFHTPDLTTELTKIKAAKADLVIVSGYFGDGLLIAQGSRPTGARLSDGRSGSRRTLPRPRIAQSGCRVGRPAYNGIHLSLRPTPWRGG